MIKQKKPSNRVFASNYTQRPQKLLSLCKRSLLLAMGGLRLKNRDVGLVLVTNSKIQKLNRKYRNINKPTDVLSFGDYSLHATDQPHLGDIAIAVSVAGKNAKEDRKPLTHELILLSIHGLLHLLGYDHQKAKDAKKMFSIQNRLTKNIIKCLTKNT